MMNRRIQNDYPQNKMVATSRFKVFKNEISPDQIDQTPKIYQRVNTEPNQSIRQIPLKYEQLTLRTTKQKKSNQFNLSNLLKKGQQKRQIFMREIYTQNNQFIKKERPKILKITKREKENIQNQIRKSLCQPPKQNQRYSQQNQKFIRNSFNKKLKQIRMRKYVWKDEENQIAKNKLQAYAASIKGDKHSQNQDSLIYSEGVYIICDGHGTSGKQISEFVSNNFYKFVTEAIRQGKLDIGILKLIVKKTEMELQISGIDIVFSGCTLVSVIFFENIIYCLNIGDSKAILCQGFTVLELCTLHKPDHPVEKHRIQAMGGVVHPIQISKDKYTGPNRIWAPGKNSWGPGLALSRAFGDRAAKKYGVTSQPDIKTFQMTYEDQYIILGSDGLYDFMKDQDINYFMKKKLKDQNFNKQLIAEQLASEAKYKSIIESDDISCIVIFF